MRTPYQNGVRSTRPKDRITQNRTQKSTVQDCLHCGDLRKDGGQYACCMERPVLQTGDSVRCEHCDQWHAVVQPNRDDETLAIRSMLFYACPFVDDSWFYVGR